MYIKLYARFVLILWIMALSVTFASCTTLPETIENDTGNEIPTEAVGQSVILTPTIQASEIPLPTPSPTIKSTLIASTTLQPTKTTAPNPAMSQSISLEGPLIGYSAQHLDGTNAILILDLSTETFRIVKNELTHDVLDIKWQENGCQLEGWFGDLFDLKGNIISSPSRTIKWDILAPQDNSRTFSTLLSPNGTWLAYNIAHGKVLESDMVAEAEFNDIGIINLANPEDPIFVTSSGRAGRYAWSPDSQWLSFSDEDENGITQLYRFSPSNHESKEQLTFREENLRVGHQVWSPDGNYIATSIRKGVEESERGHLEIIDLQDLSRTEIIPDTDNFSGVRSRQVWWSSESDKIMFSGRGVQDTYTQIYWADVKTGEILDSFMNDEAPWETNFNVYPVGGLDTVLLRGPEYYLLERATKTLTPLSVMFPESYLSYDYGVGPFTFPGEDDCEY